MLLTNSCQDRLKYLLVVVSVSFSLRILFCMCGRLDLKHMTDLSKMMRLYDSVSTCQSDILHCCLLKALRSSIVKKMFYSYDVGTGCFVNFNSVLVN